MITKELQTIEPTLISEACFMVEQLQLELQRDNRATEGQSYWPWV